MKSFWLMASLLVASSVTLAAEDSVVIDSTTSTGGFVYELSVPNSFLLATRKWCPGQGEPPLSPAAAVEKGLAWAKKEHREYDDIQVKKIEMHQSYPFFPEDPDKTRWYYLLEFAPIKNGKQVYEGYVGALVLMDGTVIGPTVTKYNPD